MSETLFPENTIYLPDGFAFSSVAAGIKASGRHDLALIECCDKTTAAALFTTNRVAAAPVQVGLASLRSSRGSVRAVIVNSGNANCATGPAGLRACQQICREVARSLHVKPHEVLPSSTGIIGVPLPADKIIAKLPQLIDQRRASSKAVCQFAQTIMTTDMRPKVASAMFSVSGRQVRILGVAKGSGMIHPKLATMLVYLFTDVVASRSIFQSALRDVCDQTFNCISVDGDTSTNDTVLLLASGKSGVRVTDRKVDKCFKAGLLDVCHSLARQIVGDGEGVQHVIQLTIEGAPSRKEALLIARAIAHSPLVKTAWAGADPNWGRILAAVGNSGVPVRPELVNIFIGDQQVCRGGCAYTFNEESAHKHLSQPQCDVRVQVGRGRYHLVFYTTDLSTEYVRINADYST
jgi:glutamate N-acetyltransferase/amino-acid N-acetyltransferase